MVESWLRHGGYGGVSWRCHACLLHRPKRTGDDQLQLTLVLAPEHPRLPRPGTSALLVNQPELGFDSPLAHFMRNVLAHADKSGRRAVSGDARGREPGVARRCR